MTCMCACVCACGSEHGPDLQVEENRTTHAGMNDCCVENSAACRPDLGGG